MTYKGFDSGTLSKFGVNVTDSGAIISYFTTKGELYRKKVQRRDGFTKWLGKEKDPIPYGLETVRLGGNICFMTDSESCAWSLRVHYPNIPVIAVPEVADWKAHWAAPLDSFKRVFLLFRGGDAGRALREKVLAAAPLARVVVWPDGMDTRDVLQHKDMGRPYCSAAILAAETALDRDLAVRDGDHVDTWLKRYTYLQAQGIRALREAKVIL